MDDQNDILTRLVRESCVTSFSDLRRSEIERTKELLSYLGDGIKELHVAFQNAFFAKYGERREHSTIDGIVEAIFHHLDQKIRPTQRNYIDLTGSSVDKKKFGRETPGLLHQMAQASSPEELYRCFAKESSDFGHFRVALIVLAYWRGDERGKEFLSDFTPIFEYAASSRIGGKSRDPHYVSNLDKVSNELQSLVGGLLDPRCCDRLRDAPSPYSLVIYRHKLPDTKEKTNGEWGHIWCDELAHLNEAKHISVRPLPMDWPDNIRCASDSLQFVATAAEMDVVASRLMETESGKKYAEQMWHHSNLWYGDLVNAVNFDYPEIDKGRAEDRRTIMDPRQDLIWAGICDFPGVREVRNMVRDWLQSKILEPSSPQSRTRGENKDERPGPNG